MPFKRIADRDGLAFNRAMLVNTIFYGSARRCQNISLPY